MILADMSILGISAFLRAMSQNLRLRETLVNAAKTGKTRSFFQSQVFQAAYWGHHLMSHNKTWPAGKDVERTLYTLREC